MNYLFKSSRLGFRNWITDDLPKMIAVSADPEVMRYFPGTKTKEETLQFIETMQQQFEARAHCYFAVELFDSRTFIGFIGLAYQTYEAPFTPCVDIGWRLATGYWGKGYATEGAKACLEYGWGLGIEKIFAVAPRVNLPSIKVMQKIGMEFKYDFQHPLLEEHPELTTCVLYRAENIL